MLQSHTATQQWQSFEMRMRRRRVERCLLRASVAIEAGVLSDASDAIDEIRRLDPNEPGLEPLAAQLANAANSPTIEPLPVEPPATAQPAVEEIAVPALAAVPAQEIEEAPAGNRRFAAAAVLLIGAAGGAWLWSSTLRTPPPSDNVGTSTAQQAPAPAPPAPSVRLSETSVSAAISAEPLPRSETPAATSGLATVSGTGVRPDARTAENVEGARTPLDPGATARISAPGPPPDAPASPGSEQRQAFADARSNGAAAPSAGDALPAAPSTPTPTPAPAPPARLEPLTGLPETPAPPSPRVVAGAEGISAPDAAARSAAPPTLPPAPAPEPVPARSDEQNVRAVLGRYESAYTRLDAAAAASVWPGVNQRALANAFEGLSAQAISLGQCDIRVTGTTARAECSGNARWTPKVGGGAQSAQRQWRFDLRNAGGNWLITQATAR